MKRKYLALIPAVLVVSAVVYATHGMWGAKEKAAPVALNKPPSATQGAIVEAKSSGPGFDIAYEPLKVKASVKPYTVKADLSNVANAKLFGTFTAGQKALLAKNGFFAAPTDEQQLFFIYEQNDYKNVPSFITTDSVLQVYHIFYDFTLRKVESGKLYDVLSQLTDAMITDSKSITKQMTNAKWRTAAQSNEAFFLVAARQMGKKPKASSSAVGSKVEAEMKLIGAHQRGPESAIFPYLPDYSQFIPRGHYTRSKKLKQFFGAMMWYGYIPFPVDWQDDKGDDGPAWPQIRQALLITRLLFSTKVNGRPAIESWEKIYEPTVFYVGKADDLTPYQYKDVMDKVYGKNATYAQLQDETKLAAVYKELLKFPEPGIKVAMIGYPGGRQLRFMGQRYIPDSEILQEMVNEERQMPKALDVMAVLGSDRASDISVNIYKEPSSYLAGIERLRKKFDGTPGSTWRSNLYWGWLWGLDSLLDPFGAGYPSFMVNTAWLDKNLNTSLGSWAELRHDTILYAKQSGIECGGDETEEPPMPKGYVEPNVEFYSRLLWLTKASSAGLGSRGLLTDELKEKFGEFEDLLTFLRDVSVKELTNEKLTREEYDQIRIYGANIERLTLSVIEGEGASSWYEITSEADKDMALIADVHTAGMDCLEEGVGHANEIYVVVPIEGKLYLTRGAVFSYYEFIHPSSDRLTDEKWQKILKSGKASPPPIWTGSFLTGRKQEVPTPRKVRSTGC